MENNINTTIFLVEAFATNRKLERNIDKYYNKNKYDAYNFAVKSELYNHTLFKRRGIDFEIRCKKVLGLILISDTIIEQLIKEGWRAVYGYIQRCKILSLDEIQDKFYNSSMVDDDVNGMVMASITLANILDKPIDVECSSYQTLSYMLETRLKIYDKKIYNSQTNELVDKYKQSIERLYKKIKIKYGEFTTYQKMGDIAQKHFQQHIENFFYLLETEELEIDYINKKIYVEDIYKILGGYIGYNKIANPDLIIDVEGATLHLIDGLNMKFLVKDYKKAKEFYFKNNKETLFAQIQNKDLELEQLKEENKKMLLEKERLESKVTHLEQKAKDYDKTLKLSLREKDDEKKLIINAFEEKLSQQVFDVNELDKLRNFFFAKKSEENCEDGDINSLNILVVTGNEAVKQQLAEADNIQIVDGFNSNTEVSLQNIDLVCFHYGSMSHKVYYKIKDLCQKSNTDFCYINHNNKEKIIEEIKKSL